MNLSRRKALALGGAVITVSLLPVSFANASSPETLAIIAEFTGGVEPGDGTGTLELTTPEIAENGNTVPISMAATGATAIMVLADGNPSPGVITFRFGELAEPRGASRIRLAGTQNVIAVAQMADGSFLQVARSVKVTIGGCGG
jgi:sulfur-oxidizing protein SoxY